MAKKKRSQRPPPPDPEAAPSVDPADYVAVAPVDYVEMVRTLRRRRRLADGLLIQQEFEGAAVDTLPWNRLQLALEKRPRLRPHLELLHTLRGGFSRWMLDRAPVGKRWPREFTAQQRRALEALEERGVSFGELSAVCGSELWSLERAWALWLVQVKRRSGLSRPTRNAIRAALDEYAPLLRPTKNPAINQAIAAAMAWLANRVSHRLAYRAIGAVIDLAPADVRKRHAFAMRNTPRGLRHLPSYR
jgi:hypothetical protein